MFVVHTFDGREVRMSGSELEIWVRKWCEDEGFSVKFERRGVDVHVIPH